MEKFGGREKVIFGPFSVLPFYLTCSPKHNEGTQDRLKNQATFREVVRIRKFEPLDPLNIEGTWIDNMKNSCP